MAPENAALNGDGFRFYRWEPEDGSEPTDVLSVTSIRKLCGEPYNLVNWMLANLADAALGTMPVTVIGPRGGVSKKRPVAEFPSEFVTRYMQTEGEQGAIDSLRSWLREQGDSARDTAAVRGTIVHWCIENSAGFEDIDVPFIEAVKGTLSSRDQKKMRVVKEEDLNFIRSAVQRYWEMRASVPFVIVAREMQVWNLTAGYAGSADALVWFLPDGVTRAEIKPAHEITADYVRQIGGSLSVLDWKTSTDIHTDNVVQVTAYTIAEFVGSNGVIDRRLTGLLELAQSGGIVHVRPDQWNVYRFHLEPEVVRAFLGSVALARFLAKYPQPDDLFTDVIKSSKKEAE